MTIRYFFLILCFSDVLPSGQNDRDRSAARLTDDQRLAAYLALINSLPVYNFEYVLGDIIVPQSQNQRDVAPQSHNQDSDIVLVVLDQGQVAQVHPRPVTQVDRLPQQQNQNSDQTQ
ncbi:hypothetical protein KBC04_03200 [Candidatus Babeliales bacterium]|nr:hypothetical protein [Candidatus Babeliales bacterium]MBP9843942.1 hypothetical protein [Candidatus Babeliales bacterium]